MSAVVSLPPTPITNPEKFGIRSLDNKEQFSFYTYIMEHTNRSSLSNIPSTHTHGFILNNKMASSKGSEKRRSSDLCYKLEAFSNKAITGKGQ